MSQAQKAHLLEVCVDDPNGLSAAIEGGADRIELCAALAVGGLTPSPGLMAAAARIDLPVFAMIRPRAGNFVYDAGELAAAEADIAAIRAAGLSGIVLGATRADGRLDREAISRLRDAAGELPMALHRAIDASPDHEEALETAIELGFCRVLTAGGASRAAEGAERIAQMARQAAGRITIMAGGCVDPSHVDLLLHARADDLHGSCGEAGPESGAAHRPGIPGEWTRTRAEKVRALRHAIEKTTGRVS